MKLTFLIAENCFVSGVTSMLDVFTIANLWQHKLANTPNLLFTTELVSRDGKVIRCGKGVQLVPDRSITEREDTDFIILPPFMPIPSWNDASGTRLTSWLTNCHRAGIPIAALCTGAFLLAESGLLDGREATTNWQFARRFQRSYPGVRLRPEKIITEEDGLICTGAATAYFDFALTLIKRYGSEELARVCSKALLLDTNRTSQSPYHMVTNTRNHRDESILQAQQYIEKHYASIVSVDEIAAHAGISSRHFKRRFKQATGISPLSYLQNHRIELAKKKLELTLESIDDITRQIGYENASTFRRLFKRQVSMSPRAYRDKFAAK